MLKNLLFTHGRESYRRKSYLILYMFYKNLILVIPVWTFGCFSLFSGTYVYNNLFLNFYNVVFTALPIIWFGVFDWEHTKEDLMEHPKMYEIGLNNVFFNWAAFWRWTIYAFWQGIVICILIMFTLSDAAVQNG